MFDWVLNTPSQFIELHDYYLLVLLPLSWRRFVSYRNQSIDWFVYDSHLRHGRDKFMDNKLVFWDIVRSGSGAAATSKMECFVIIVNGFTKRSILDVAAALDPPLIVYSTFPHRNQTCNIYIFNVRITIRMLLTIIKRLETDIDINIEIR